MDSGLDDVDFAIGMFDCNDLKRINDEFGHDRGDTYLKAACRLICRIFQLSVLSFRPCFALPFHLSHALIFIHDLISAMQGVVHGIVKLGVVYGYAHRNPGFIPFV